MPKKALAENNPEKILEWYLEGVTWIICNSYKGEYLPD